MAVTLEELKAIHQAQLEKDRLALEAEIQAKAIELEKTIDAKLKLNASSLLLKEEVLLMVSLDIFSKAPRDKQFESAGILLENILKNKYPYLIIIKKPIFSWDDTNKHHDQIYMKLSIKLK